MMIFAVILSLPTEAEEVEQSHMPTQEVRDKMLALVTNLVLVDGEGIRKWDAFAYLLKKERATVKQLKEDVDIRDDQIAVLSRKVTKLKEESHSMNEWKTKLKDKKRTIKKLKGKDESLKVQVLDLQSQLSEVKFLESRVAELEAKRKIDTDQWLAQQSE